MAIKDKVLELLEGCTGEYLSGEDIAERLGCTRGAVWKGVKSLQEQGYTIKAVTNKGYSLDKSNDILSEQGIAKTLGNAADSFELHIYDTLESTFVNAREFANSGSQEGLAVICARQTKGRGRLGRSFFSPMDTGVYMSVLLRPKMAATDAVKITTAAAVAVADAVDELTGERSEIKWVNDVYLRGKKICGILTEASFNLENGGLDYAIVGIGVNVYAPKEGFPEDIQDKAGAVFQKRQGGLRNKVAALVLKNFWKYYTELEENTFYEGYRSRVMWIGEKINIITPKQTTPATLIDVDKDCRIVVRFEDGSEKTVSTGEISIRSAERS